MTNENTKMTTFGERLMQARSAAMLSRTQLATATGIPAKAIEKFEYGTQDPTIVRLKTLAKALNVEADYLMTGDGVTMPKVEDVTTDEAEAEVLRSAFDHIAQKLSYLDELREAGFQKYWRTAPRLFEEIEHDLSGLDLDDLLDLAEKRNLFPVSDEELETYYELDGEERNGFESRIIERVLDTAYFGLDLHSIRKRDLIDLTRTYEMNGDKSDFWSSKWSGIDAVVTALQDPIRCLALKGQSPDFSDEKEYKKREVA